MNKSLDEEKEVNEQKYVERVAKGVEGLVSIIVPCLNMELYLEKCIDSLLGQTYSNLEVIIVDNASKDASVRMINEYARKDNRVKLIQKKKTTAVANSRNMGLDIAKGEYIWFVDSDDYAEPNFLEVMIKRMNEEKVNIVQCCYTSFDDFGNEKDYLPYKEDKVHTGRQLCKFMFDFVGLCGPNVMVWNKLYRRSVVQDFYFYEGKAYEDMFTTYKILYGEERVLWIADRLMHWRKSMSSATSAYNYREFYLDEIHAYIQRLNYFKEVQDAELYKLAIKRLYYIATQHLYLYTTFINDKVKVCKQNTWLRAIIKQLYPEIIKMQWPMRTKLRMRFIRYFPKTFGRTSVKHKLDFRK